MQRIIPRAEWGFDGWNGTVYQVPIATRSEFFVHFDGAVSVGTKTGFIIPRGIHRFHRDVRGWAGIGYNFVVDNQTGAIYEGRGWNGVGAHCTNHNRSGIGVQLHIGGDDTPSPVALRSLVDLYLEGARRAGHALAKKGHRDGMSTSCPGDKLYSWVRAGMPAPAAPTPAPIVPTTTEGFEMNMTEAELKRVIREANNEWAKSDEGALAIQRAVMGAGTYGDPDGDGDQDRPVDMLYQIARKVAELR